MHVSLYAFSLFTSFLFHLSYSITVLEQSINFAYLKILKQPMEFKASLEVFNIYSDQIIFHPPQCAYSTGDLFSAQIDYKDCTVFSVLNMTITVNPNYTFTLENFYIEYHYPEIHYELENKIIKVSFTEDPPSTPKEQKFAFNRNRAPLSSSYFSTLTTLLEKSALEIRERFKEKAIDTFTTDEETFATLESHLTSSLILLNLDSITTETGNPYVTYYSFLPAMINNVINLKEVSVVGKMTVQFEYSVRYNLTYQEGSFIINHFGFDAEFLTENDVLNKYTYEHFLPVDEKPAIKDFIFEKFKEKFVIAIKKFYSIKNQQTVSNSYLPFNGA